MPIYNEHQLRAEASKLREEADRVLAVLERTTHMADMLDGAAAGRVSQDELQAAVDEMNNHQDERDDIEAIGARMDDAFDKDDAIAWAKRAAHWLQVLPEDQARIVMEIFSDALVDAATTAMQDFFKMPAASEVRQ